MSKGKAAPYSVWLVWPTLAIQPHHLDYPKMSEAIRVAKKRCPRNGWAYVKNRDGVIVGSTKGFNDIKISLAEAIEMLDRMRKS